MGKDTELAIGSQQLAVSSCRLRTQVTANCQLLTAVFSLPRLLVNKSNNNDKQDW